ncbi:MAG: thioredoxin family protein [Candidatus Thermoplasmatota archaeon]
MNENSEFISELTDNDHEEFIEGNEQVVLDLWATWCNPCVQMNPLIENLAEKYDGEVKFAKVNIENNGEIPSKYGVQSLPSFLFFKDGELIAKERGKLNEEEFEEKLQENFDI